MLAGVRKSRGLFDWGNGDDTRPVGLSVLAAAACVFLVFAIPVEILGLILERSVKGPDSSTNWLRVFRMLTWPALAAFTVFLWMGFRWARAATQVLLGVILLVAVVRFFRWVTLTDAGMPWAAIVGAIALVLLIYLNTARVRAFCSLRSRE